MLAAKDPKDSPKGVLNKRVFALIGPSGTGKSHKAMIVAKERGINLIIDDGLLIMESKILAGKSAKREPTRISAVRRAIFSDPLHAMEVRMKLAEVDHENVLVLGTSREMVNRICNSLSLPAPVEFIDISTISSPEEIRRAQRIRREQGKHVIPAPTFEVRKTFSGYLVNPLRLFIRPKDATRSKGVFVEKSVVRPTYSSLGRFYIADSVIMSMASNAAAKVNGVKKVLRVLVETQEEGVTLSLDLSLSYGTRVFEVLEAVQSRVKNTVEYMTSLNVLSVRATAKKIALE